MDIKAYIASGILELYVAGSLTEKENLEVYENAIKYPEIQREIEEIEQTILVLTKAASTSKEYNFEEITPKLINNPTIIPLKSKQTNWFAYTGWAASIVIGMYFGYTNYQKTQSTNLLAKEKQELESKIEEASQSLAASEKLLEIFRDKEIITVPLSGQTVAPEAYAKVYWDKKTNTIYLDAKGLPTPPKGKVYQVWSLKLSPLTPTSLGTLDTFTVDTNKIFTINNANQSEAFGITLEPEGGSVSPTLEQLYTLGAVSS